VGRSKERGLANDRGAIAIIVALFMVAAMILLAFVIDRGRIYVARAQLQNAVDAAALAGAQEFCISGGNASGVASQYAQTNGVPNPAITVQSGTVSYINVRGSESLQLFFGPFASAESATVAAQATASRSCQVIYRFVADTEVEFTGNNTDLRDERIYGGECFSATGTGNQFGVIAVSTSRTDLDTCGNGSSQVDAIDLGGLKPDGTPKNTVVQKLYREDLTTTISVTTAANSTVLSNGKTIAQTVLDVEAGAYGWRGDCDSNATPPPTGDVVLYCDGGDGKFTKMGPEYTGIVVATNDIDLDASSTEYANVLIATTGVGAKITMNNGTKTAPGVVLYAPNGQVDTTGAAADDLGAIILADSMKFAGSSVETAAGFTAYGPGPYSLIQ
jgi:Flp pilus assembly protein TadG